MEGQSDHPNGRQTRHNRESTILLQVPTSFLMCLLEFRDYIVNIKIFTALHPWTFPLIIPLFSSSEKLYLRKQLKNRQRDLKFGQIRLLVMLHNAIPAKIIYIAFFMSKWHVDAFSPLSRIPATTLLLV